MTTLYDAVIEEGAKFDIKPADDSEIENIIWSHTGYPCFWPNKDKTPEENFRAQLQEYFEKRAKKAK